MHSRHTFRILIPPRNRQGFQKFKIFLKNCSICRYTVLAFILFATLWITLVSQLTISDTQKFITLTFSAHNGMKALQSASSLFSREPLHCRWPKIENYVIIGERRWCKMRVKLSSLQRGNELGFSHICMSKRSNDVAISCCKLCRYSYGNFLFPLFRT